MHNDAYVPYGTNEAAKILALLQGTDKINIDALKRSVLCLNETLVEMKKNYMSL